MDTGSRVTGHGSRVPRTGSRVTGRVNPVKQHEAMNMETLAELMERLKRQAADDDQETANRAMDAIDLLQRAADEARWIAAGLN